MVNDKNIVNKPNDKCEKQYNQYKQSIGKEIDQLYLLYYRS